MHVQWTTFIFKQYSIQRRNDETRLVLEASGDFLLEEEDAPVTILEEVQDAEMEVDFAKSTFFFSFVFQEVQTAELEVLEIDSIQALRTDQVFLEGCGLESLKSVNETTTLRKSDSRCSSAHTAYNYTMTSIGVEPGEKSSVLKCLLQDPEFGKSRGRIKVV